MGDSLRFGRGDWKIVGVFDAGRTAFDSEIWGDLNQIATDFNRNELVSSALVRAVDPIALQALKNSMAYSLVTQPFPCPRRNEGTVFSIVAVQITRVLPTVIKAEPSALRMKSG